MATNRMTTIEILQGIKAWSAGKFYIKSPSGIPKSDLASNVQSAITAAETALQPSDIATLQSKVASLESLISEGSNPTAAIDKFNEIVAFLASITNTETLSGIVSGINDAIAAKQATLVSGTNIKTINNTSLLGSGNISVGTYSKPSSGIPSTDLESGVQTSLALANSALQPQDISGKQDKLVYEEITSTSSAALVLGKDYYVSSAIATFAFTLANNPSNGELSVIFTTGASPAITITSDATIYTQEGFSIDANSTYEMNIKALNGSYYVVLVKMEAV